MCNLQLGCFCLWLALETAVKDQWELRQKAVLKSVGLNMEYLGLLSSIGSRILRNGSSKLVLVSLLGMLEGLSVGCG